MACHYAYYHEHIAWYVTRALISVMCSSERSSKETGTVYVHNGVATESVICVLHVTSLGPARYRSKESWMQTCDVIFFRDTGVWLVIHGRHQPIDP